MVIIAKLSELLIPSGISDAKTSPRSPLDFRIQSPRGVKKYEFGGIGLGIVAALEKSGDHRSRLAVRGSILRKSSGGRSGCENWEAENSEDEDYTFVTSYGPEKSVTKVYYHGCEQRRSNSPGPAKEPSNWFLGDGPAYPISDFLSSCHLCRKNLHGKDIYMYRGEKGFCSPECRSNQIAMDEMAERKCRSEVSRSEKIPTSLQNSGQIFSTGILAIECI